jgi:hypothetical protein
VIEVLFENRGYTTIRVLNCSIRARTRYSRLSDVGMPLKKLRLNGAAMQDFPSWRIVFRKIFTLIVFLVLDSIGMSGV